MLTAQKVMGKDVRGQSKAWAVLDALMQDERVSYASEPSGLEPFFRSLTQTSLPAVNVWMDAYLAGFSRAAGLRLITFDRVLSRLAGPSGQLLV